MSDTIPTGFKRKVLKLDKSPIDAPKIEGLGKSKKQIVPTKTGTSFREKHREIYLPILIQVIELRGRLELMKNPDPLSDSNECPEDILRKLEALEGDIVEARRWCDGVMLQLSKAKHEAEGLIPEKEEREETFWERVRSFLPW